MTDTRVVAVSADGDEMEVEVVFSPLLTFNAAPGKALVRADQLDTDQLRADKVRLPEGGTAWVYMDGVRFYDPESRQEFALLLA